MPKKELISKILVPVDGSDTSFKAAEFAIDIAKQRKGKIVALYIMHLPRYLHHDGIGMPFAPPDYLAGLRTQADAYLCKVSNMAKKAGVAAETAVIENDKSVVQGITDFAEKQNVDLIIMGTRGMTGIKKVLLGSVAEGVLKYAHCPVLVVR